jgi:hypothetical protein
MWGKGSDIVAMHVESHVAAPDSKCMRHSIIACIELKAPRHTATVLSSECDTLCTCEYKA